MDVPARAGAAATIDGDGVSHNLLGQRLGRKGRGTRERIMAAADRVLADADAPAISLSAVAREASLAMTTLYLYFSDLTELLLAVLEPVMASAEESYVVRLRARWPDDRLGDECIAFVTAFHGFWRRHARALHMRNSNVTGDLRMVHHRINAARPLIELLIMQMDGDPADIGSFRGGTATVLMTAIERLVTATTDDDYAEAADGEQTNVPILLAAQARLLELAIRDGRQR